MDSPEPFSRRTTLSLFIAAAVLAGVLRALVINNDLWLDEVWSVQQATTIESPADIFLHLHHDNNHHLNTLWLWVCGSDAGPVLQRSLSFVAGILAIFLTGVLTLRWGHVAATVAMLMASCSIVFVQYATEARGYSLAVCFALAAHWCLRRHLTSRSLRSGMGFGILCTLGVMSHLSFLQYYFAATYWTSAALADDRPPFPEWCVRMFRCHALAIACLGIFYVVDVRYLTLGGGPRMNAISVFINAVSIFAGGALDAPHRFGHFVAVTLGIIAGLRHLVRRGDDEWKFFACLFLLFPVFRVVLLPAGLMYERYFLILLAFAVIPVSVSAVRLLQGHIYHRIALGMLAAVFVNGNVQHLKKLAENGRGQYRETMAMIANESPEAIRISSDHPFRNRLLIEYFAARCATHAPLEYIEFGEWTVPPEWMICHSMPRDPDPAVNFFEANGRPRTTLRIDGTNYTLRLVTNTAELSGCDWLCYQLDTRPERLSRRSTMDEEADSPDSM